MGRLGFPGFGLHATLPSAPLTPAALGHQTRGPFRTRLASSRGGSCPGSPCLQRIPGTAVGRSSSLHSKVFWEGPAGKLLQTRLPVHTPKEAPSGNKNTPSSPSPDTTSLWTLRFQEANTLLPLLRKVQISGRSVPHTNVPYQYL